ncbi:MAG: energy transducer TonB [Sphingomonas paucimobilis]
MGARSGLACAGFGAGGGDATVPTHGRGGCNALLWWRAWGQTPPERIGAATWLTDDDYPAAAFRNGEEGVVKFAIDVDRRGKVAGCRILQSGGVALDQATCRALVERLRFKPARDADGKAIAGVWQREMRWKLPGRSSTE